MAAGIYNFTIEQGTTVDFEVQYKDSNSLPVNLTGYSGRMQIRSNYADNKPVTYITLSSSIAPDGTGLSFSGSATRGLKPPTSGSIGVYILAESSSAFNFAKAKYDLEIYSGSFALRLLEGTITLSREVTRVP
jgi:hypothetical protein